MLTLAFDTATATATSALVWDGEVLGERARAPPPCSRTSTRSSGAAACGRRSSKRSSSARGRAASRGCGWAGDRAGLSFSLDVPLAGVSTLAALAAGSPEALPVIDARRGEVFVLDGEPRVLEPEDVDVRGRVCVGDGAVRYRVTFEEHGARDPARRRPGARPARALPRAARRRASAPRTRSSRSTCVLPTRSRADARDDRVRRSRAQGPRRDRAHRARVVRDAVVALDVRRRAREGVVGLPRRARRDEHARRLPDHLAVRGRLARDEHRRRSRPPPPRRRDRAARATVRAHRGRRHGAATRSRCASRTRGDQPVPAPRLPAARHPPRLLHGQPRGRADHVARPPAAAGRQ